MSINRYLGQNFYQLINRIRVEEAKRILREAAESDTPVNITEIGAQSGFGSRTSFFMCFARYEGMSPKTYIKQGVCPDTLI